MVSFTALFLSFALLLTIFSNLVKLYAFYSNSIASVLARNIPVFLSLCCFYPLFTLL